MKFFFAGFFFEKRMVPHNIGPNANNPEASGQMVSQIAPIAGEILFYFFFKIKKIVQESGKMSRGFGS